MTRRTSFALVGLFFVLGLIGLAAFLPPDGRERNELAQFFGSFHPLAVHLPIALLLLAPLMEFAARGSQRCTWDPAIEFVLGLATLSAIAAPYLGWLLARSKAFDGAFVTQHMWGGISVAGAALLCWVLRCRLSLRPAAKLRASYLGVLALTIAVVAFTGYRGGQLAHGESHLTEDLPPSLLTWLGIAKKQNVSAQGEAATFYGARIAPIFEDHCLVCHSTSKRKGGLQLDSYAALLRGGKHGAVIKPGDAKGSDLFRRVSLDRTHKDFMPAEGKPPLSDEQRKLLELWINAGASPAVATDAIAGAPAIKKPAEPLAPDYRPVEPLIARLESSLKVKLLPLSRNPTDGLVLRTASFPAGCDDASLAKLAPVARYIVDAELARTQITDVGLKSLAEFTNLRRLDLSHTNITSTTVLSRLPKLEVLNLTATFIDDAGATGLKQNGSLKRLYIFDTQATQSPEMAKEKSQE